MNPAEAVWFELGLLLAEQRPWLRVLSHNLAIAGALQRSHLLGVAVGIYWEADHNSISGDLEVAVRTWRPGCGRPAPVP